MAPWYNNNYMTIYILLKLLLRTNFMWGPMDCTDCKFHGSIVVSEPRPVLIILNHHQRWEAQSCGYTAFVSLTDLWEVGAPCGLMGPARPEERPGVGEQLLDRTVCLLRQRSHRPVLGRPPVRTPQGCRRSPIIKVHFLSFTNDSPSSQGER